MKCSEERVCTSKSIQNSRHLCFSRQLYRDKKKRRTSEDVFYIIPRVFKTEFNTLNHESPSHLFAVWLPQGPIARESALACLHISPKCAVVPRYRIIDV